MFKLFLLIICSVSFACKINNVEWLSKPATEIDVESLIGKPCESWTFTKTELLRDYENSGFIAAKLNGYIDSNGTLFLTFDRGSAWVWGEPKNLDSSKTKHAAFVKQTGIVPGNLVSLLDLERSDLKLARSGYYNKTAPVQMYRDANRNRIIPAYHMRYAAISEAYALLTYSSENNLWEGNVNVSLYNILGSARDLLLEGFSGKDARRLEAYYKEPWIFSTDWNLLLRGYFDEDSSAREALGEVGISREINFDFTISVFMGLGNHRKTSTLEISYASLDRFVLPRKGSKFVGAIVWNMGRPDSLDNYLKASASFKHYVPIFNNWIVRASAFAGGIFPTNANLDRLDYFSLGGIDNFRGMDYRFVRSRAYGYSEYALLWQYDYNLSIEAFYQPGLYRAFYPRHGWLREQDYGVAFTQYRGNWSVNLYYALRNGENYLDGIIGFGLKTLF